MTNTNLIAKLSSNLPKAKTWLRSWRYSIPVHKNRRMVRTRRRTSNTTTTQLSRRMMVEWYIEVSWWLNGLPELSWSMRIKSECTGIVSDSSSTGELKTQGQDLWKGKWARAVNDSDGMQFPRDRAPPSYLKIKTSSMHMIFSIVSVCLKVSLWSEPGDHLQLENDLTLNWKYLLKCLVIPRLLSHTHYLPHDTHKLLCTLGFPHISHTIITVHLIFLMYNSCVHYISPHHNTHTTHNHVKSIQVCPPIPASFPGSAEVLELSPCKILVLVLALSSLLSWLVWTFLWRS